MYVKIDNSAEKIATASGCPEDEKQQIINCFYDTGTRSPLVLMIAIGDKPATVNGIK
jgi:hypothetical protein